MIDENLYSLMCIIGGQLLALALMVAIVEVYAKLRRIRWPSGRYNGRRIVGLSVKLQIDITMWNWKPIIVWRSCGGIHWLCFLTWTEWVYARD